MAIVNFGLCSQPQILFKNHFKTLFQLNLYFFNKKAIFVKHSQFKWRNIYRLNGCDLCSRPVSQGAVIKDTNNGKRKPDSARRCCYPFFGRLG